MDQISYFCTKPHWLVVERAGLLSVRQFRYSAIVQFLYVSHATVPRQLHAIEIND